MRTLSASVQALRLQADIRPFFLVRIGDTYRTSFYRDLAFNGNTYLADGMLHTVEPPKALNVLNRSPFKIVLADPDVGQGPWIESVLFGASVEVYVAYVDPATNLPGLSPADVILTDSGTVDSVNYVINTEEAGESLLELTCTNPLKNLDMTRAYYTSQNFCDQNYPGDTSFESIYEGAAQVNLQWGRA